MPDGDMHNAPDWLMPEARELWNEFAGYLQSAGLLKPSDWLTLAILCNSVAEWRQSEAWMQANGRTMAVRDDKGQIQKMMRVPQHDVAEKAQERIRKASAELGLTPSARSGLKATGSSSGFDFSKFQNASAA